MCESGSPLTFFEVLIVVVSGGQILKTIDLFACQVLDVDGHCTTIHRSEKMIHLDGRMVENRTIWRPRRMWPLMLAPSSNDGMLERTIRALSSWRHGL